MWAAVAVESAISVVRARRGRRGATVVTEAVRAEDVLPALPKAIRAGACGEDTGGGEAERLGEVSGSALEGLVTAARGDRDSKPDGGLQASHRGRRARSWRALRPS